MKEMKKIDRTNYELFVISYLDGTLDPVETAELLLFLEQNPDLKEEVSGIAPLVLNPDQEIQYNFKELLLQPADVNAVNLSVANYHHYFIAAHEGDLSPVGLNAVKAFIGDHPELKNDYELYAAARLVPNMVIRFPDSGRLKKPVISGIRRFIYLSAAAASILVLITLYLRLEPQRAVSIAENNRGKEIPDEKTTDKKSKPLIIPAGKINPVITPGKEKPAVKADNSVKGKTDSQSPESSGRNSKVINRLPARQILNNTPEPFNGSTRNFYSSLFEDITKAQEPLFARLEQEDAEIPENSPSNSRTGRRVSNLLKNGARIASQVNQSFSGWMLADIGIEGINALTDNDLKLERIANPDGSTGKVRITENGTGYAFTRKPN